MHLHDLGADGLVDSKVESRVADEGAGQLGQAGSTRQVAQEPHKASILHQQRARQERGICIPTNARPMLDLHLQNCALY